MQGRQETARNRWKSSCFTKLPGQTGFLSINALVSSWKWNNKWVFTTLSGLFHAWMFSLNFSATPLGKQSGDGSGERQRKEAEYREWDKDGVSIKWWKLRHGAWRQKIWDGLKRKWEGWREIEARRERWWATVLGCGGGSDWKMEIGVRGCRCDERTSQNGMWHITEGQKLISSSFTSNGSKSVWGNVSWFNLSNPSKWAFFRGKWRENLFSRGRR